MNELEQVLSRVTISQVWQALGGAEPRCGRAPAIWRDTRDRNISLNDSKGTWYDFRDNTGGGIIALIQQARGSSPKEAVNWLSDFTGIPLERDHLTPAQRRERARQWREARIEAERLVYWKRDLLQVLRDYRGQFFRQYHAAEQYLRLVSVDEAAARGDLRWEPAFDVAFWAWPHVEDLDRRIDRLERASYPELLPLFRAAREGVAA